MSESLGLGKGFIVGIGNSMLDLIGHVDDSVLQKYSLKANNGYLMKEEQMPILNELQDNYNAKYVVGGSVQNTFRVTQWILGEPGTCVIYGAIGCDKQGEILVGKARADGVDTQYQYIDDKPTGICAVLLTKNGAERTLVANLSAAKCFKLDHLLKKEHTARLRKAAVMYVSGFVLAVNVDAILYAADIARQRCAFMMMNLSAAYVAEEYMAEWDKVMPYIDVLFGNDTEAKIFAVQKNFEEVNDVSKIALELSRLPKITDFKPRVVVITQGHNPVVLVNECGEVKEFPVLQLHPDDIVDSTGAGDAFVGGFLAEFVRGSLLKDCVTHGIWYASQMIQQQGCTLENFKRYPKKSSLNNEL